MSRAARPRAARVAPAGEESGEDAEGLGDLERAVMGQHHTAGSDAQSGRSGCKRTDQRLRTRSGEHRTAVMLSNPVAVVAERIAQTGEVERVCKRLGAGPALGDRRLVENAEAQRLT